MKAYEPARKKPLYCRVCKLNFKNVKRLMMHRNSEEHKTAEKLERKLTFCKLCKKQFTSMIQLDEHVKGRWHKMRVDKMIERSNRQREGKSGGRGRGRSVCMSFNIGHIISHSIHNSDRLGDDHNEW